MADHPWQAFLDARYRAILWLIDKGKTPDEIARTLSMDADQVVAILAACMAMKR